MFCYSKRHALHSVPEWNICLFLRCPRGACSTEPHPCDKAPWSVFISVHIFKFSSKDSDPKYWHDNRSYEKTAVQACSSWVRDYQSGRSWREKELPRWQGTEKLDQTWSRERGLPCTPAFAPFMVSLLLSSCFFPLGNFFLSVRCDVLAPRMKAGSQGC